MNKHQLAETIFALAHDAESHHLLSAALVLFALSGALNSDQDDDLAKIVAAYNEIMLRNAIQMRDAENGRWN